MPTGVYVRTEETKRRMSIAQTGREIKWADKIGKALKGRSVGHKWKKGHKCFSTPESIEKTRQKLLGRKITWAKKIGDAQRGEKGNNWQGGIWHNPYATDWNEALRRKVRERDGYICQLCGESQIDETPSVHHIDYDKKNSYLDNLITLCNGCHVMTNYNRKYWEKYFNQ